MEDLLHQNVSFRCCIWFHFKVGFLFCRVIVAPFHARDRERFEVEKLVGVSRKIGIVIGGLFVIFLTVDLIFFYVLCLASWGAAFDESIEFL
jgi:hypothetical protein